MLVKTFFLNTCLAFLNKTSLLSLSQNNVHAVCSADLYPIQAAGNGSPLRFKLTVSEHKHSYAVCLLSVSYIKTNYFSKELFCHKYEQLMQTKFYTKTISPLPLSSSRIAPRDSSSLEEGIELCSPSPAQTLTDPLLTLDDEPPDSSSQPNQDTNETHLNYEIQSATTLDFNHFSRNASIDIEGTHRCSLDIQAQNTGLVSRFEAASGHITQTYTYSAPGIENIGINIQFNNFRFALFFSKEIIFTDSLKYFQYLLSSIDRFPFYETALDERPDIQPYDFPQKDIVCLKNWLPVSGASPYSKPIKKIYIPDIHFQTPSFKVDSYKVFLQPKLFEVKLLSDTALFMDASFFRLEAFSLSLSATNTLSLSTPKTQLKMSHETCELEMNSRDIYIEASDTLNLKAKFMIFQKTI